VVEVVFKPAEGVSGPADKEREEFLRSIATSVLLLALHPRCLISVTVQVMHDDGGVLACAINAMCLALADSGLRMRAMVAATVCAVTAAPTAAGDGAGGEAGGEVAGGGGRLLLDPDLAEEQGAGAVVITAHEHKAGGAAGVVSSHTTGRLNEQQYFACLEASSQAALSTVAFMRTAIEARLHREHASVFPQLQQPGANVVAMEE